MSNLFDVLPEEITKEKVEAALESCGIQAYSESVIKFKKETVWH